MTTMTLDTPTASSRTVSLATVFGDAARSEWTKLRSVRSTYWTLLATVIGIVGISALVCSIYVHHYPTMSASDRAGFDPTSFTLSGVFLAQLAIGVLGVLTITNEYRSGAIRSTLTAVPQRGVLLAAKASVFAAVTMVVGLVSCFTAYFLGQSILSSRGIESHLGDPGVIRAVIGGGLYLTVLGLLALAIGALIRHSAGAIATLFGVLLVLPGLIQTLPSSWTNAISKYLPSSAGQAIAQTVHAAPGTTPSLSPWIGFAVFCLYAAVAAAGAAFVLRRRDA